MFEVLAMKKLLVATILLSAAAYGDVDVVTDVRRAALSYLGTGKQVSRGNVRIDEDESLLTAVRRTRENGGASQRGPSNRFGPVDRRCAPSPTTIVSVNVRDLLEKKNQLSAYNSEICAYFRQQGWMVENPLYADEPSWVEVANDYAGKLPLRLEFIDPYVLSRGKRVRRWRKNDGNSTINDLEADRIRRKRDYREGARSRRDSGVANAVAAKEKNGRILGQRNKHLVLQDLFEQPYFISRGKKTKHRFAGQPERTKSGANRSWNDGGSDRVSSRFAETPELDSRSREAEHFGQAVARKRAKPSSDRKSLLDQLLTDSDLFYVGRGKRTSAAAAAAESTGSV
ncbi:uncharacterized protein LOC117224266 [Megalopta genalis]|uniref:uncharacterized protein LOC117224266 n=1 Tax=Megalopta genalis TaxID=115081 RepID=UPI003FD4C5D2